jgi:hypothetical protein
LKGHKYKEKSKLSLSRVQVSPAIFDLPPGDLKGGEVGLRVQVQLCQVLT